MVKEIHIHLPAIKALCRKYHFSKLWIFGSARTPNFRPDSDVDFLYELNHQKLDGRASIDSFFAFKDEAEKLLGHLVDLVWYPGLRNPFFKQEVAETKVLIYDAQRAEVAVLDSSRVN